MFLLEGSKVIITVWYVLIKTMMTTRKLSMRGCDIVKMKVLSLCKSTICFFLQDRPSKILQSPTSEQVHIHAGENYLPGK